MYLQCFITTHNLFSYVNMLLSRLIFVFATVCEVYMLQLLFMLYHQYETACIS